MDFTKDIYINKDEIVENSEIVLLYKGYLFENNRVDNVYISYGYGDLWENKSEIKMKSSTYGYLATMNIENGETLQFCFRNDSGQWDNNNGQNYILPIKEKNDILEFEAIPDTRKDVEINIVDIPNPIPQVENNLETSVVSSNSVSFADTMTVKTVDDSTVLNNTQFTESSEVQDSTTLNSTQSTETSENENILWETISNVEEKIQNNNTYEQNIESSADSVTLPGIQSEDYTDTSSISAFSEITQQAKVQSAKAFDEDKVTAGSVYVNSIVNDIDEQTDIQVEEQPLITGDLYIQKSLVTTDENELTVPTIFDKIKLFFNKMFKLVKSVFTTNSDED